MRQRKYLFLVIFLLLWACIAEAAQSVQEKNMSAMFREKNPKLSAKSANRYAEIVVVAAKKYKVDPYVIAGIIIHESTVNNKAVSKGGDYGLMQVRWNVHEKAIKKEFPKVKKAKDMFDARTNIFYGTEIYAYCASKTSTTEGALLRYSAGSQKLADKVLATVRELRAREKNMTTKKKVK